MTSGRRKDRMAATAARQAASTMLLGDRGQAGRHGREGGREGVQGEEGGRKWWGGGQRKREGGEGGKGRGGMEVWKGEMCVGANVGISSHHPVD